MSVLDVALAALIAGLVWVGWGFLTYGRLHDMGPDEALRATFSPRFWRTGELA